MSFPIEPSERKKNVARFKDNMYARFPAAVLMRNEFMCDGEDALFSGQFANMIDVLTFFQSMDRRVKHDISLMLYNIDGDHWMLKVAFQMGANFENILGYFE